ncbi:hypothetical protein MHU86_25127 [Fragilaria crotonensis]|nr:hypothetical protein MHU86_25127 [Fragilaria crotonensis]
MRNSAPGLHSPDFEERILLPSALSVARMIVYDNEAPRERRAVNCQMSQSAMQLKKTSVADDDSTLFSRTPARRPMSPQRVRNGASNRSMNAALPRQKKVSNDEPKK